MSPSTASSRSPIDPDTALREWLGKQVGGAALKVLSRSQAFGYFVAAAPGARELITIAKIWELAQDERWTGAKDVYDLVIVDAPASGHGVAMLRTPDTSATSRRAGRSAGRPARSADAARPEAHGLRRRRHAGGDAGQRDAAAAGQAGRGGRPRPRRDRRQRPATRSGSRPPTVEALRRWPTAPAVAAALALDAPRPRAAQRTCGGCAGTRARRWSPSPTCSLTNCAARRLDSAGFARSLAAGMSERMRSQDC